MLYSNLPHRYDFYRPSLSCHVISWKSYITKLSSIGMSIHPYVLLTSFAPITATVIVMQTIAITSGTIVLVLMKLTYKGMDNEQKFSNH